MRTAFLFLILSFWASAQASPLQSARNEWQARIQDWSDDRELLLRKKHIACTFAGLTEAAASTSSPLLAAITFLQDLPKTWSLMKQDPEAQWAFEMGLQEMTESHLILDQERKTLVDLQKSVLSNDPEIIIDSVDQLRVLIEIQAEVLRIVARLYDARTLSHLEATQNGVSGFLKANLEVCLAFSMAIEKDEQLIRGGRRILAFYDFLEAELSKR